MIRIIKTGDGSHTLYVPDLDEHYHSVHGAVRESECVYIKNGLDFCRADPVNLLEIGFGAGLNALLTAVRASETKRSVHYISVENNPLSAGIVRSLNYSNFIGAEYKLLFGAIHSSPWETDNNITPYFTLRKMITDFTSSALRGSFDLIYYDAFGPDKQPGMWTVQILSLVAELTSPGGTLVTYSAKGNVKRNLRECGFDVTLLPGPPGKRHVIRAIKI